MLVKREVEAAAVAVMGVRVVVETLAVVAIRNENWPVDPKYWTNTSNFDATFADMDTLPVVCLYFANQLPCESIDCFPPKPTIKRRRANQLIDSKPAEKRQTF